MKIIGIDPGQAGGIAVYDGHDIETYRMPDTFADIYILLKDLRDNHGEVVAYMEKVGQGMPGQSSKATATFARHNGHLEMALYALGIRTEQVTPQKWMKHFSNSLGKSSDCDKRDWKNRLKGLAQRLFPNSKVTLWNCDAMLIACYGYSER